jgi:hypothetical protein
MHEKRIAKLGNNDELTIKLYLTPSLPTSGEAIKPKTPEKPG